jgi:hypothetical protein
MTATDSPLHPIEEISYRAISFENIGEAVRVAAALREKDLDLKTLEVVAEGSGYVLKMVAADDAKLEAAASELAVELSVPMGVFLFRGDQSPSELGMILEYLEQQEVRVTAVDWNFAGQGTRTVLLSVRDSDVRKTAALLDASGPRAQIADHIVDEASDASFPASDPPSFTAGAPETISTPS